MAKERGCPSSYSTFAYDALPPGHIRLLTIEQNSFIHGSPGPVDIIRCGIRTVSMADARAEKMSYKAISYAWGISTVRRYVLLNGAILRIGTNLYNLLWQLIRSLELRQQHIWVDAICIDQTNKAEKSGQVAMMGEIYQEAEAVLVWLGTAAELTVPNLERFWEWVISKADGHQNDEACQYYLDDDVQFGSSDGDVHSSVPASGCCGFHKSLTSACFAFLDQCDWFKRAWTFQEIQLARKAEVLCGDYRVDWLDFAYSVSRLVSEPLQQTYKEKVTVRRKENRRIIELLEATDGRKTTDPRDRIFSLYGMYNGDWSMKPDYGLSVREVWAQATFMILQEEKSLAVLNRADVAWLSPDVRVSQTDRDTSSYTDYACLSWITLMSRRKALNSGTSWIPNWNRIEHKHYEEFTTTPAKEFASGSFNLLHPSLVMDITLEGADLIAAGVLLLKGTYIARADSTFEFSAWSGSETATGRVQDSNRPEFRKKSFFEDLFVPEFQDPEAVLGAHESHDPYICTSECEYCDYQASKGPLPRDEEEALFKETVWCCWLFGADQPTFLAPCRFKDGQFGFRGVRQLRILKSTQQPLKRLQMLRKSRVNEIPFALLDALSNDGIRNGVADHEFRSEKSRSTGEPTRLSYSQACRHRERFVSRKHKYTNAGEFWNDVNKVCNYPEDAIRILAGDFGWAPMKFRIMG